MSRTSNAPWSPEAASPALSIPSAPEPLTLPEFNRRLAQRVASLARKEGIRTAAAFLDAVDDVDPDHGLDPGRAASLEAQVEALLELPEVQERLARAGLSREAVLAGAPLKGPDARIARELTLAEWLEAALPAYSNLD